MFHFYHVHHIIFPIFQFCIGSPLILGNYGHQIHTLHLVSAARQYQWNSKTSCCSLTFYQRMALLCRQIRSSWACFVVFYWRINPSYRRPVCAPPFTPLYRHNRLREHNAAPLCARTDAIDLVWYSNLCPFHNIDRKPTLLRRLLSLCPRLRNNLVFSAALTARQSALPTFALSHLSGSGLT